MARQHVFGRQKGASAATLPVYQQPALLDEVFRVSEDLVSSFPHSKRVGNYLVGKVLGEGAFAKVRLGLHVTTGMYVAIKIISKETIKNDAYMSKHYRREPKLLQLFVHPNIVQLYEVLETDHSLYLIMELCDTGDVVQLLKNGNRPLTELDARRLMRQLLSAVEYIHRMGVLHRDLKAENFLLSNDSTLKITDFGLSTKFRKQMSTIMPEGQGAIKYKEFYHQTQCGSPAYASPEILSQQAYCQPADVWSLGVNMFYMLHCKLPFMVEPFSMHALLRKVRNYEIEPLRADLTHACRDLLQRLLCLNDSERITIGEAMSHPWITHNPETGDTEPLETYNVTKAAIVQGINRTVLKYVCTKVQRAKLLSPVEVIQIISSNAPHEFNALYHLLLKKLAEYCEANSLTVDEFEARNEAKQTVTVSHPFTATAIRPNAESSYRNPMAAQQLAAINRPLRRPQTNRQAIRSNPQQTVNRQQLAVQPNVATTQGMWKARVAENGDHGSRGSAQTNRDYAAVSNGEHVRSNAGNHMHQDGPIYVNVNDILNANANATVGEYNSAQLRSAASVQRSGEVSGGLQLQVATNHRPVPTSPLPNVNERSCSTPSTPTLLRRADRTAREDSGYRQDRRVSTAGSALTKPEISKPYYQRLSLSSNRVDTLGINTPRIDLAGGTTMSQGPGRRSASTASQQRSINFAKHLTTDFNI